MLVKLTGEQVSRHWIETIKPAIANSLPAFVDLSNETMNNILMQILSDALHCWVVMVDGEVVGVCTTLVTVDVVSKTRAYLIYSLYNLTNKEFPESLWDTCMLQVAKVAKTYNCDTVYCFTDNPQVAKRAEQNGGSFMQHLITFNI